MARMRSGAAGSVASLDMAAQRRARIWAASACMHAVQFGARAHAHPVGGPRQKLLVRGEQWLVKSHGSSRLHEIETGAIPKRREASAERDPGHRNLAHTRLCAFSRACELVHDVAVQCARAGARVGQKAFAHLRVGMRVSVRVRTRVHAHARACTRMHARACVRIRAHTSVRAYAIAREHTRVDLRAHACAGIHASVYFGVLCARAHAHASPAARRRGS
eukprot:5383785-Pleurochrysis_carterae.AAC.1